MGSAQNWAKVLPQSMNMFLQIVITIIQTRDGNQDFGYCVFGMDADIAVFHNH
jgi:hypothetical protein